MDLRNQGIAVLKQRLKDSKDSLGLKTFAETPGATIDPTSDTLPAIILIKGPDSVDKRSSRRSSYPARRIFEVTLEMVTPLEYDIESWYRSVRTVVLESDGRLLNGVYIEESRAEGPSGYDIPGIQGMRLVLSMVYIDSGN